MLGYEANTPIPKPSKIVGPEIKIEPSSPQSPPAIKSEDESGTESEENADPAMAEFALIKKEEDDAKHEHEQVKEEEEASSVSDSPLESDEEDEDPESDAVLFAMNKKLTRVKNYWKC